LGEAVEALAKQTFDVIVCDYLMPDGTGLDLLEALGADHPPFIMLTGELSQNELEDPRVCDVTSYLTKPVSTDDLRIAIDHAIG
jgi:CheY-like chemotaxis protein